MEKTLTVLGFTVQDVQVDVAVLEDLPHPRNSVFRHLVQIRIADRPAWTGWHRPGSRSAGAEEQLRSACGSALSLLSQYLHGWAQLRHASTDRRHEWSGWAERYAEHVRAVRVALDRIVQQPEGQPYTVALSTLHDIMGVDSAEEVFGPARTVTVGKEDDTWTVEVVDVPVVYRRTHVPADLWNTAEVARWWGIDESAVNRTLGRAGVTARSREPGRSGRNLYSAEEILVAKAATGRGTPGTGHTS